MSIKGTVAEVRDEYTIVANIGSEDGVEEGQVYAVYTLSDPIEDPETGDELGRIEYKKISVVPIEIHENMSVMLSDEKTESPIQTQLSPFTGSRKKVSSDPEFQHGDKDVEIGDDLKLIEDPGSEEDEEGAEEEED